MPLTFLVLDDESDARFLNSHALGKMFPRCEVIAAASLDEAGSKVSFARIDAVVTDNSLGGDDGAEVTRQLHALGLVCPIVMVTNHADPEIAKKALAAGVSKVFLGGALGFADYLQAALAPTDTTRSEFPR